MSSPPSFLADTKCDLDITQAIKMPPMPGQSRSLLHFTPTTQIKREIDVVNVDAIKQEKDNGVDGGEVVTTAAGSAGTVKVTLDHDYFGYSAPSTAPSGPSAAKRAKISILAPSHNKPPGFVGKEVRFRSFCLTQGYSIYRAAQHLESYIWLQSFLWSGAMMRLRFLQ